MGSLRGPCLGGSSVCGTPAWDVPWSVCLPCPPSCVSITAYILGSFTVCRCTGSTVHMCVCLYSSVFALAGPSFTAVARGHKSLGEGKSMKSMCVYLKMVMGDWGAQWEVVCLCPNNCLRDSQDQQCLLRPGSALNLLFNTAATGHADRLKFIQMKCNQNVRFSQEPHSTYFIVPCCSRCLTGQFPYRASPSSRSFPGHCFA